MKKGKTKKGNTFSIDILIRKTKADPSLGYLSAKITVNGDDTEVSLNEKVDGILGLQSREVKGQRSGSGSA